jgi:S-adenosylmethionine/arginine decarboxylase-like enzyme
MDNYGKELILDLHYCDPTTFNRESIKDFFEQLCKEIDMEKCELFFWDDEGLPPEECQTEPHLKGTSAVQFIMTSNITIHTLDIMKRVYLNIFSCKDFDPDKAMYFSANWFKSREVAQNKVIDRI